MVRRGSAAQDEMGEVLVRAERHPRDANQAVRPSIGHLLRGAKLAPIVRKSLDVGDLVSLVRGRLALEPALAHTGSGRGASNDGTSSAMALFPAVPIAPEELSTCSRAGDNRASRVAPGRRGLLS